MDLYWTSARDIEDTCQIPNIEYFFATYLNMSMDYLKIFTMFLIFITTYCIQ